MTQPVRARCVHKNFLSSTLVLRSRPYSSTSKTQSYREPPRHLP